MDSTNWVQISGIFVAAGGEDHVTIGNFFDSAGTQRTLVGTPTGGIDAAYYYIDDVSVTLVPEPTAAVMVGLGLCLLAKRREQSRLPLAP